MTNGNKQGEKQWKVAGTLGLSPETGPAEIGPIANTGQPEARYNFTKINFFINIR